MRQVAICCFIAGKQQASRLTLEASSSSVNRGFAHVSRRNTNESRKSSRKYPKWLERKFQFHVSRLGLRFQSRAILDVNEERQIHATSGETGLQPIRGAKTSWTLVTSPSCVAFQAAPKVTAPPIGRGGSV